jgi:hypothetical protein
MPQVSATTSSVDDATVASGNTPLTCSLFNPPNGVEITEAAYTINGGAKTPAKINTDGQGFNIPIATPGNYVVGVTVNKIPAPVNVVEATAGRTLLLSLYPENVSKNGTFTLKVTP